ncbi:hypothetical protein ACRALDRAFT_2119163 [Sodiomyces alcalophilus JCM 7366]|uniref:uncharacterized protein n=1 Tax=Sodiomyces alcalophilus JCM 7366 TaxID=591952 RepID=UPI0039B62D20
MATATLLNPNHSYHAHPPQYSPSHQPGPAIPGMMSSTEPRGPSEDAEQPYRQPLPSLSSLSEVISGAKSSPFPPSQPGLPGPTHSFPSPFGPGPAARQLSEPSTENHSPRALHPTSFPPRPEGLPPFSDPARPSAFPPGRQVPPPLSNFSGPQPSPPTKAEHIREPDAKSVEHNISYQQQQQQQQQHPVAHQPLAAYPHTHPTHLPPGQIPLPSYPASPRHPSLPSPYEVPRPGAHPEEPDYASARVPHDRTLNRALDAWGYTECLSRISRSSRTIAGFADGWVRIAAEQHGAQPIPERLPTEREVTDMLNAADYVRSSLEAVRHLVQETNERARLAGKTKSYEPEDAPPPMYENAKPNGYGTGEVKKRRGRAAPPGRCHSCNRIDTPEWRRGPDGARTLCNACGLHYAKLERKRQLEARQIRPKSPPRP